MNIRDASPNDRGIPPVQETVSDAMPVAPATAADSEYTASAVLDALSTRLAILDRTGTVLAVNRAWRQFAEANSLVMDKVAEGANYLAVCEAATGEGSEGALEFAAGIRAVLQGKQEMFEMEYPCHSPSKKRWFVGRVTRLPGNGEPNLVVAHEQLRRPHIQEELATQEAKMRALFELSPIGISLNDLETGEFLEFNAAVHEPAGYTAEEFRKLTYWDLTPKEYAPQEQEQLLELERTGRYGPYEKEYVRKDGTRYPVRLSGFKMTVTNGRKAIWSIVQDISAQKESEAALRSAKERAEAASVAKSEFLANMSHEIRTPMNGVIGMTDLLLDTGLNSEQIEYAETIHSCSQSLLSLINDILDFSKVEAGQIVLEDLEFHLRTTVEETIDVVALKAQEKGIDLVCMIGREVPEFLRGDPGRLRQVLFNLVGNAVKFTHAGGVTVQIELASEIDCSVTLRFSITDTGIGIPLDKLDLIFTKFIQADPSTTRQFGGTGLGLAISRQLVELFGGQIGVTSEESGGSMFWFTAVFRKSSSDAVEPAQEEANLVGAKVLVVDDFKTNRTFVTRLLKNWGCRFSEAHDASSAIAKLRQAASEGDPFAAVLLDMNMPTVNGAGLGRLIKSDDELNSARLVMLTSLGKRGDAERLAGVGFSGYLPKPIRPALLRKCLALVLGRQDATASDHHLVTRHTVAESKRKRLRILVAEDNTTNRIIAVKMLEKLGHAAEAVANGEEAVESLRRMPYDLVFMDCQMPVMDGLEATRILRSPASGASNPGIPIIALTAHAMKEDRDRCLAAGMNDYVTKPASVRSLAAAIERCLSGRSLPGGTDPHAGHETDGHPHDFDREGFLERTLGDHGLACEVAAAFLADTPALLQGLSAAISAGDTGAAGKFAHTLKGSAGSIGGVVLGSIAAEMQAAGKNGNLPLLQELFPAALDAYQILSRLLESGFSSPHMPG
ncbi:MAG: response regulator [Verrucomicrobiota bacterium]